LATKALFTEELLRGSRQSAAVVLDMKKGEYVVSTSRLFKFVETQIAARKINVSDDPENPICRNPRINGEHVPMTRNWHVSLRMKSRRLISGYFFNQVPRGRKPRSLLWINSATRREDHSQSLGRLKICHSANDLHRKAAAPGYRPAQEKMALRTFMMTMIFP